MDLPTSSIEPTPRSPLIRQDVRGVRAQEHSAEWIEESELKHQESVAILSQQLQSMIPRQEQDREKGEGGGGGREVGKGEAGGGGGGGVGKGEAGGGGGSGGEDRGEGKGRSGERGEETSTFAASSPRLGREPMSMLFPTVGGERSPLTNLPCSPEVNAAEEEAEGDADGRERAALARVAKTCMKRAQCEVLGPYSCADCTKIRLHERQHRQETSLYPDLSMDPRGLVAPARIRQLTAMLPASLTSQRHTLDCGCAVHMHPDFLFPVIVTDHDIQSRVKLAKPPEGLQLHPDWDRRARPSLAGSDSLSSLLDWRGERGDDGFTMFSKEREGGEMPRKSNVLNLMTVGGDDDDDDEEKEGEEMRRRRKTRGESRDGRMEEAEEEAAAISPVDMKVTVRYTSPSSQIAFITE